MIEIKKKRFREKIGQVFQIPLSDGRFGYCQMVSKTKHAFFDFFNNGDVSNINEIVCSNILFYLAVDYYIFKEGVWKLIGFSDVQKKFVYQEQFTYDDLKGTYVIWRVVEGILKQIPATQEEIYNLECFASWNERYARERLEDYLASRSNYCVERFRNEHDPNFPGITEFYEKYGYDYKLDKN